MAKIILNCLLQNDSLENLFKVDIDGNQLVKELEEILKTILDLDKVSLKKVEILISNYERDFVFKSQNMESSQKIYEYFGSSTDEHYIHVLICQSGKNLKNLRFFISYCLRISFN